MADDTAGPASTRDHDRARDLVEDALGKLADDQPAAAEKLIDQARRLDPSAAREVVADLDEDAGSNHTPQAGTAARS